MRHYLKDLLFFWNPFMRFSSFVLLQAPLAMHFLSAAVLLGVLAMALGTSLEFPVSTHFYCIVRKDALATMTRARAMLRFQEAVLTTLQWQLGTNCFVVCLNRRMTMPLSGISPIISSRPYTKMHSKGSSACDKCNCIHPFNAGSCCFTRCTYCV
jgi:hypothetical protein